MAIVLSLSGLILAGGVTVAVAQEGEEPSIDLGGQHHQAGVGPSTDDFINIRRVERAPRPPANGPEASTGTFVAQCGRPSERHRNADNFVTSPGVVAAAHHIHEYVGNTTTDANSTQESLQAGDTTCRNGDKSAYFWPALRLQSVPGPDADQVGGGLDGNVGRIVIPQVRLEFRGNPTMKVTAMPLFLRTITGDARATTSGGANIIAKWTCTRFTDRITSTKYPRCPRGSEVVRILDHPSCWDGQNTDSANHRTHLVHPDKTTGACPEGFKAVPQLRMTLTYRIPQGAMYAVDAFPEQEHHPSTDHADFANMMPADLMNRVVGCINSGRRC